MPGCQRLRVPIPSSYIFADENLPKESRKCLECGNTAFVMHRSIHDSSELRTFECSACGEESGAQLVPVSPLQVEKPPI